MLGEMRVVGAFSRGETDYLGASSQFPVGAERPRHERLLKPQHLHLFECRQP